MRNVEILKKCAISGAPRQPHGIITKRSFSVNFAELLILNSAMGYVHISTVELFALILYTSVNIGPAWLLKGLLPGVYVYAWALDLALYSSCSCCDVLRLLQS